MKISLDTDVLIKLCKNENHETDKFLKICKSKNVKIIIGLQVSKEFFKKMSKKEEKNFEKLNKYIESDPQKYFTISESVIGGPDIMPGPAYKEFNHPTDTLKEYKKYQEKEGKKSSYNWIQKRQSDPKIYSRAVDLDCDYLLTQNTNHFKGKDKKYKTKIITLNNFINF